MPATSEERGRRSDTHDRAVLRQDNGELQEDVVAKESLDAAAEDTADEDTTEQSAESFPASDPPSHWAGGEPPVEDPHHGDITGRVVDRSPVEEVPERTHPAEPVPRTLPRH